MTGNFLSEAPGPSTERHLKSGDSYVGLLQILDLGENFYFKQILQLNYETSVWVENFRRLPEIRNNISKFQIAHQSKTS